MSESQRATLAAVKALDGRDAWWLYENNHLVWLQGAGLIDYALRITDAGRAALRGDK